MAGNDTDFSYADDDELVGQFVSWTTDALKEMRSLVDGLAGAEDKHAPAVTQLYDLSHNIKGMGSSFDFVLMTAAGSSLCNYLKLLPEGKTVSKKVVDAHVRLFEVVLANRITGDGGERGGALIDRLQTIIAEESAA